MSLDAIFKFRLYVAGSAETSTQAISNLTALCRQHLPNRHQIEIVDVFRDPVRAMADGVLMTPMLMKLAPVPTRRIVGSLSQEMVLLHTLGLVAGA